MFQIWGDYSKSNNANTKLKPTIDTVKNILIMITFIRKKFKKTKHSPRCMSRDKTMYENIEDMEVD